MVWLRRVIRLSARHRTVVDDAGHGADRHSGAVLATLPVVLIYIPVQKYVISGLTSGAVKG